MFLFPPLLLLSHSLRSLSMDRPENLIRAFQSFDADKSGKVSTEAMRTILTTMGNVLTPEEVSEFVADADQDGWIDYRAFVHGVIFSS